LCSTRSLRRILKYATYYNETRTHVSLGKDAPYTRPIERMVQPAEDRMQNDAPEPVRDRNDARFLGIR